MNRNSCGFKALFTFRNWILDVKSTFLMHSNSLNVSLVSLCDSFDALTAFVLFKQSIGKGKRGNEFAEWHVTWLAEWHNYPECNISRLTQRNKSNWKLGLFCSLWPPWFPDLSRSDGACVKRGSGKHMFGLRVGSQISPRRAKKELNIPSPGRTRSVKCPTPGPTKTIKSPPHALPPPPLFPPA